MDSSFGNQGISDSAQSGDFSALRKCLDNYSNVLVVNQSA